MQALNRIVAAATSRNDIVLAILIVSIIFIRAQNAAVAMCRPGVPAKEVYLASYDADGRRLEGPVVTRPAEVATDAPVAGAGPLLYPDHFPHAIAPDRPSAGWMAAGVSSELVGLLDPEPLYLRRPDAVAGAPRKPVS